MKTASRYLQRYLPLYLPFLLLSIASAFLFYLALLGGGRRMITCGGIDDFFGCNYTFFKSRLNEGLAQIGAYSWFLAAQLSFHGLYKDAKIYTTNRQIHFKAGKLPLAIFCMLVIVSGFGSLILVTWQLASS